jgi:hypothetical protein
MRELRALTERHTAAQQRGDFRAAQICALMANINRDSAKRAQPYGPSDFFPSLGEMRAEKPAIGGENAILDNMRLLALALGSSVTVVDNG